MSQFLDLRVLIEPRKYELDFVWFGSETVKQMTSYDLKHMSDCKDLLELIIRAYFYGFRANSILDDQDKYDIDEIDEYDNLVRKLMGFTQHIPYESLKICSSERDHLCIANDRYRDFMIDTLNDKYDQCYFTAVNETCDCYYVMAKYNGKICELSKINQWQAEYFAIFNTIYQKCKNNVVYVDPAEQYKKMYQDMFNTDECKNPDTIAATAQSSIAASATASSATASSATASSATTQSSITASAITSEKNDKEAHQIYF